MIAILFGWLLGWLMNGLSDTLVVAKEVSTAVKPTWKPLGGLLSLSCVPFARLHFAVEIISMGSIGLIGTLYTLDKSLFLTAIYAFLLLITLIDLKYYRVFNVMIYPAFAVVLVILLSRGGPTLIAHLVGGMMAFGIFMMAAITTRGGLGGGDIKLAGLLGLAFGFPGILWVLLVGTGLGALFAVGALISKAGSRSTRIAYAPFLCAGALVVLLALVR